MPVDRYATAAEMQDDLERWLAQHGDGMSARAVGACVAAHFEHERTSMKELLERELGDLSSLEPDAFRQSLISLDTVKSLPPASQPAKPPAPGARPRAARPPAPHPEPPGKKPLVIGGVVVVTAAVTMASLALVRRFTPPSHALPDARSEQGPAVQPPASASPSASASASAPAPAESAAAPAVSASARPVGSVNLIVYARPATARISLDGAFVSTGFYKGKLPKDGHEHRIHVEAPGFVAMEQSITASGEVNLKLVLDREPSGAP
jgi:serine/threonine-protein kinase